MVRERKEGEIMGWSHGIDPNRAEGDQDIGYAIDAVCDDLECKTEIHRGLAHVCGNDVLGGEHGCGGFFCFDHLDYVFDGNDEMSPQLCKACRVLWKRR